MDEDEKPMTIPRASLICAALLVSFALAATAFASISGKGVSRMAATSAAETRELRFADRPGGVIAVVDAHDTAREQVLAPGTDGFVRSVMRSLAQTRQRQGIDQEPPFRLVRWSDGRLTLEDPATAQRVDLAAFGAANRQSFARLMDTAEVTR